MKRVLTGLMLTLFAALQYALWAGTGGVLSLKAIEHEGLVLAQANARAADRNQRLTAQVADLREGQAAVEELARSDLGMVAPGETFFQVVATPRTVAAPPAR